jgi:ATP-dependent helicase/nuclease subunit A
MTSETRLIDQEHRDRACQDLSRSYIVEAAAGTGKTTVLVTRIINLIRQGKARLEEVIAITFTEKAAAELKVKLRQEIEKVLSTASGGEEQDRLSGAISDLERMQVTTIHSFCGSLLRERPVEAGLDPNFEVADDLTSSLIQTEIWESWLEKQMDADDPDLRRAVLLGITTKQIREIAQSLLSNRDVLQYLPSPPPPEEVERSVEQFIRSFQKALKSLIPLKKHCKNPDEDRAVQKIDGLNEQFIKLQSLPPEEKGFYIFREVSIGSSKAGNQKNWGSKDRLEEVRNEMEQLVIAHGEAKATLADSVMSALAKRLMDYIEAYEQAKRERNFLDFSDLLIFTERMLREHEQVGKYFRDRFKFLLLDEFQDTDPLQVEIAFHLSLPNLFLVGDPKQSIYRFRRADIEMYEEAKNRMGKDRLLTISQNFRCAPSVVRFVNRVFQDLIKTPEDGQYQPEYVPLHLGRKKGTVPPEHGVVLLYPPADQAMTLESANDCRLWESRCIASFVQKLVDEEKWQVWDDTDRSFRPVMFKDIAILIRTYTPLNALEEALRAYEVGYRVVGGKYFYRRQEVQHLLSVLQSIDNPNDKVALVAALRSPFFGVSDEALFLFHVRGGDLNYLKEAPGTALEKPFSLLRELHEIRNRVSVSELLKRLYEATSGLVLFLLKPQGEQRVANLMKIGDVSRALDERGILSFRGFVRWLSEREEEEADEEEPPTLERGDDFVRILTIHRAKGLEFPVVILADLGHKGGGREDFILDRNGKRIAIKVGAKDRGFQTRNYEELAEWEEKRGEAEERRLLYVGMTRARDFLVLPVYWTKEKKGEKEVPEGSFLGYLQPYLPLPDKVSFVKWNEDMMAYDTKRLQLEPGESAPFRSPLKPEMEGGKASRSVLSQRIKWKEAQEDLKKQAGMGRPITTAIEQLKAPEEVERDDEWPVYTVTKGDGAVFGKLVHRLFEKLDWNQPDLLEKMAGIEGRALGVSESMRKKAQEMVREALKSPPLQRFIKSGRYQKEVPFSFKNNGTLFEGVMDVVLKEEDGLTVLDFKTDLLDKKNLDSKLEHYRPQARVYSDAVETIFGKPPKEVIFFFLHLMETVSV